MGDPDSERRRFDRRYDHGQLLMAAFAATRRPLSFDDLARIVADRGAKLSDVADWLATARSSGLVEDCGFDLGPDGAPVGPRLFVLAPTARSLIRVDRRRADRRRSA